MGFLNNPLTPPQHHSTQRRSPALKFPFHADAASLQSLLFSSLIGVISLIVFSLCSLCRAIGGGTIPEREENPPDGFSPVGVHSYILPSDYCNSGSNVNHSVLNMERDLSEPERCVKRRWLGPSLTPTAEVARPITCLNWSILWSSRIIDNK